VEGSKDDEKSDPTVNIPSYALSAASTADTAERNEIITIDFTTENVYHKDELVIEQEVNQQQQPDWCMKYIEEKEVIEADVISPVSKRELISWSFQIARGMDYLASKKVNSNIKIIKYYCTFYHWIVFYQRFCTVTWPLAMSF
jgi:hypothetical protein